MKSNKNEEDEQSAEDDVIDRDEEEFDDVADSTHDGESDGARSGNFLEL